MKKIIFILLFLGVISDANAGNFIYPFAEVANPKCRFSSWSTLSSDCKIPLPRIESANYTKYKDNATMRRVYSILWGATYNYGWDVGFGSHLGVDIATSAGTPVRSIGDGEVITASWVNGWGNTVVIKHILANGGYVYSNYSHMSKIIAKKGPIGVGETIGEVGNTGNSYGNHLHFQIDITNQSHPYWYTTCSKGIDIMDVVNNGQCRDYLLANTIDPILFIEGNGKFESIDIFKARQSVIKKIEQKNIKTREQILDEEIDEFLKGHVFELKTGVTGDNLKVNTTYLTKLNVYVNGKPFNGNLPGKGIEFIADKSAVRFFPDSAIAIDNGSREIQITGLKSSKQTIKIMLGKKLVATADINFFTPGDFANPTDAIITTPGDSIALGEEKMGGVVFKTKFGSQQVFIPFDGTYKLRASSGKVKFCNVSNRAVKECWPLELASELEFRYADTKNGVLLFNMVALDYSPIKLSLIKVGQKNEITWTKKQLLVANPSNLDPSYAYFQDNIESIKKGYIRLNGGYLLQDREVIGSQLKSIVTNILSYEYLRSGDDIIKKQKIIKKIISWQEFSKGIDGSKKITRGELSKIIFSQFGLQIIKNDEVKLNDEKGAYKDYITSLRTKYNFNWKDQFSANYFQPDKALTTGETLYFLNKMIVFVQI